MAEQDVERDPVWLGWARVGLGLLQGLAIFYLHRADENDWWPARSPEVFAALTLVFAFAPLVVIGGLERMRTAALAAWVVVLVSVLALLGWHDRFREFGEPDRYNGGWPTPATFAASAALTFIGHHLIQAGDVARRWIAPYERYFDLGWRHGAQVLLAVAFTVAFWILLRLGAALFEVIGIDAVTRLIEKDWFHFPATGIVFALGLHLTDQRSALVRGVRALGLTLLSWLMPVMTLLAGAFLLTLPFTGLGPLWETRAAGAILLGAAASLIILVNAAYQDGGGEATRGRLLRWAGRVAALLLIPLVALAAIALGLRVFQHGWTPERVQAAACIVVGGCYAGAYAVAAFWRPWLKFVEIGNVATSFVVIAVLLALFTPIADPARLSVANQLQRLHDEQVTANDFDYVFLRFESGRYGREALQRLQNDRSTEAARQVSDNAQNVTLYSSRWEAVADRRRESLERSERTNAPGADAAPMNIRVLPEGSDPLPESFLAFAENVFGRSCRRAPCTAMQSDFEGDGVSEVIFVRGRNVSVYRFADERWTQFASARTDCRGAQGALSAGQVEIVPAQVPDLLIDGERYRLRPNSFASCSGDDFFGP